MLLTRGERGIKAFSDQTSIDRRNRVFWDELCGTSIACRLGITDDSRSSLARFDSWYFGFYPYLDKYIPFAELAGKRVLEVGLGYGSIAQKIAASGAIYYGLDIAVGPLAMAVKRLEHIGVAGDIRQGSILAPPFGESTFDWIVAIGSLHHTGNLEAAIDKVGRLLKGDGEALFMVYSATSYRQWSRMPGQTLWRIRAEPGSYKQRMASDECMRVAYDANLVGAAAPETEFVTKRELRHMCRSFHTCAISAENIGAEGPFRYLPRSMALRLFGSWLGLDLYVHVTK